MDLRHTVKKVPESGINLTEEKNFFLRLREFCDITSLTFKSHTLEVNNGSFVTVKLFSTLTGDEILNKSRWFGFLSAEDAVQAMSYLILCDLGIDNKTEEQEDDDLVEDAQDLLVRGMEKLLSNGTVTEGGIDNLIGGNSGLGFSVDKIFSSLKGECGDLIGKIVEELNENNNLEDVD